MIGAEIIDPQLVGPRLGAAFLLVEEDHVGFHAGRIPDAGWQAQQGVNAAFLKQVAPHLLARAALEQHVVRHHHRGAAVDLQQRVNVLHEVQLLVAGRGPEILAHDDLVILLGVALLVHEQQALLLPERRIGQNHRVFPAPRRGEAVVSGMDNHLVAADAVQIEVHRAHAAHLGRKLHALDQVLPQRPLLVAVEVLLETCRARIVGVAEESAGAGRRVADAVPGVGCITSHMAWITGRGVKYWPAPRDDSCAER